MLLSDTQMFWSQTVKEYIASNNNNTQPLLVSLFVQLLPSLIPTHLIRFPFFKVQEKSHY